MSHPEGAGQIHIVAKKKSARVVVGARLLHVVDNYLRRKQRGRGDMSSLIYEALREVDLGSVQLITIQGQRRQVTARPTKIVLPTDVRDQLDRWSEARACSMNELLRSARDSLLACLPSLDRNPVRTRVPEKAAITNGIQSSTPPWRLQAMVGVILWSE